MGKNPALQAPYACGAPRAHQTNFFGTTLIVCQITGKNSTEFKNNVEIYFCGCAGVPALWA